MRIVVLLLIISSLVFAEAPIEEVCKEMSRSQNWHRGDTVFWEVNVIPDYRTVVDESIPYANKNTTFKQALSTYGYDLDRINASNDLRLQQECDASNLNESCHHFKVYCLNKITTNTLNQALDNFSHCALRRANYCGETFQTKEGVLANLNTLDRVANDIFAIQDKVRSDSNLNMYFGDINRAYDALKQKLEEARENANISTNQIEEEIESEYNRLKNEDDRFNHTCEILDQCDDYIKGEGYADKYSLVDQIAYCYMSNDYQEDELTDLKKLLNGIDKYNEKEGLKNLAIMSIENSMEQTVNEYASTYKALNGTKPTQAQMCRDLREVCNEDKAKNALKNLDISSVSKLDQLSEIKAYNEKAKALNEVCDKVKTYGADESRTKEIEEYLYQIMYTTRIGQLMSVKDFRDEVKPFNQDECFKNGEGFQLIPEDSNGEAFLTGAIQGLFDLQKGKARKVSDLKKQVYYTSGWAPASDRDYYNILKEIVKNDPYMVRDSMRGSGDPEHALWVCKATHDIYRSENRQLIASWIGAGLAIAGAVVATVFTAGAAGPSLISSIASATTITAGVGTGIYNLNRASVARHNAELSGSIQSVDTLLNSMNLTTLDTDVKFATAEVVMSLIPGATKVLSSAGRGISKVLGSSTILNAIPSGARLTGPAKTLFEAIKNGRQITQEMLQRALASRMPGVSADKIKTLSSIMVGASEDMVIEISAFVSTFPDPPGPLSEQGMQTLAIALGNSTAFNALGTQGQQWVTRRKARQNASLTRNTTNAINTLRPTDLNLSNNSYTNRSVIQDINNPTQVQSMNKFSDEVQLNDRIVELMDAAHNAPSGFAKNRQIALLVDAVADQIGDARARQLILGIDNGSGVRLGGLASQDVMILGNQSARKYLPDDFGGNTPRELEFWSKVDQESHGLFLQSPHYNSNLAPVNGEAQNYLTGFNRMLINADLQESIDFGEFIETSLAIKLADTTPNVTGNGAKVLITHPSKPDMEIVFDPSGAYFRAMDKSLSIGPRRLKSHLKYLDKNGRNIVEHIENNGQQIESFIRSKMDGNNIEFTTQDLLTYLKDPQNTPSNIMNNSDFFKRTVIDYWQRASHFNPIISD